MSIHTPKNLYKYLSFNENTIESLVTHKAYYSDPANFNDPLDCKPIVENDVPFEVLKRVVCTLIRKRSKKEFYQMAKKMKIKSDRSMERVAKLSDSEVYDYINEIDYYSTENDVPGGLEYKKNEYIKTIQHEVTNVFKCGVLCLSRKFDSPLMWSHYANNHKGVCVEYDMADVKEGTAKKIIYGGSRSLRVSTIDEWLSTGELPEEIENVCLLTKSSEWSYENEWRLFGSIGLDGIEPRMKSVIFGMNCKKTTIATVIKALSFYNSEVKFWIMSNSGSEFKLTRRRVDKDEYKDLYSNILSDGELKKAFPQVD